MESIIDLSIIPKGKKVYFASDFHLGAPNREKSLARETRIVNWFQEIKPSCHALFLVGDIFDFWFEYRFVIPKGFSSFFSAIKDFKSAGIPIYFFTGNHDMWMFDYIPSEYGIPIIRKPISINIAGKKTFIGHGDGLGPGDHFYKFLKTFFASKFCQKLFGLFPSGLGMWVATNWSLRSRKSKEGQYEVFNADKEWLVTFIKETSINNPHDLWIFGHRHLPIDYKIENAGQYINLGEWIQYDSFASIDSKGIANLQLLRGTIAHQDS